jgi:hypothetical protein
MVALTRFTVTEIMNLNQNYKFDFSLLFAVIGLLEELNKTAGALRYWSAVRYSSSLLHQMIDSISPYVTQILVNGKRVAVGKFKFQALICGEE